MNKELWKNLSFPNAGEYGANFNAESVGFATMLKKALSNDTDCIFSFKKEGNFKSELDKTSKQIMSEYLIKNGGRLISRSFNDIDLFIWEDSIVELNAPNNYLLIEAYSFNQTFINDFKDFCEDNHIPIEKKGQVFAIVKQGSGFGLSAIGIAGLPLIESNYEPQIMEDYKYVINDLNLKDPSGRISIFRGLAGSGKTHMIRAMLNLVHNAMFVLVSPELVTELSGPNIMPLLLQYRGGTTGPIVLLIEDADKCLTSRKDNNLNEIHSLLNLGDGILGSMLDLRIVATTNAAELNIEKAISRPGRLSKMITVDALSYATACGVFTRLLPNQTGKLLPLQLKNKTSYKELTLAEVYALARKNGWVPPKQPQIIEDTDDKYYDD